MQALTAPFLAAAVLLAVAGGHKLARPAATSQALRTQHLPAGAAAVRGLGVAELAVAVLALLPGALGAWLLAAAYTGFTLFVVVPMLRGRPLSSCGCFAEPDLPPTTAHVAVTAALAGCSATVAATRPDGALLGSSPALAAGVGLSALVVAWLAYLVLTGLPRLAAAGAPPATT